MTLDKIQDGGLVEVSTLCVLSSSDIVFFGIYVQISAYMSLAVDL